MQHQAEQAEDDKEHLPHHLHHGQVILRAYQRRLYRPLGTWCDIRPAP
jgi:hypothetical protein